jgi:hypothetical protein
MQEFATERQMLIAIYGERLPGKWEALLEEACAGNHMLPAQPWDMDYF